MRNSLEYFIALKAQLENERAMICSRLAELNAALGGGGEVGNGVTVAGSSNLAQAAPKRRGRPPGSKATRPAIAAGKIGLREALTRATARGPLPIRELVYAVQQLGYRFTSKNPANSLGAYLYSARGRQDFKRANGGFVAR